MRARTLKILMTLLILFITTSACTLFDEILDPVPPGEDVPAGDQALPEDAAPSLILPAATAPGNDSGLLKPVCFLNTGTKAATVMPWTYIPLNTDAPALPSNASTVASPSGNSSACLSLPLGTYTWCYHWELGDLDGDGMIDYAHALNPQNVLLDESDPDDLDLAEKVTLSAPPGIGELPGWCDLETRVALDIRPFIVESQHIDQYRHGYSMVTLAHNEDYVTLKGPITVVYYFLHCDTFPCPTEFIQEPSVTVVIPAGETHKFYLEDTIGEHLGDWNLFIQIISIDE